MIRVLGVDPGLTRCGFGVVSVEANRRAHLVDVGVVGTPAGNELSVRLLRIDRAIEEWLERYEPHVVAVERVFSQLNVSTVMGTAQASGVVIAAAARHNIPVALHTPTEVKAAVTGSGKADKASVTKMVTKILRLSTPPSPADAADALALAIAHAWRQGGAGAAGGRLNGSGGGATAAQRKWLEAAAEGKRRAAQLASRVTHS